MINKEIPESYARATIELISSDEKVKSLLNDLNATKETFENNENFLKLISLRTLSLNERKNIVNEIFENNYDENFLFAVKIMADKNELFYLFSAMELLIEFCYDRLDTLKGIIISSIKLSVEQVNKISKLLEVKMNKKVLLENVIDKKIIGGVKVEFADKVIDGSISGKLNDLNIKLKEGK